MKRFIFYILLFALTLTASSASALDSGLEVRPNDREFFESNAGQIVSTLFRVTNTSGSTQQLVTDVELPDQWVLITSDFPYDLLPDQSRTTQLSFYIPNLAKPGNYKITYLVRSREYPSIRDFYDINVIVEPTYSLELSAHNAPEQTVAGRPYTTQFALINMSNVPETIELNIKSDINLTCQLETQSVKLNPGQIQIVNANVITDREISAPLKNRLLLTAKITINGKVKAVAQAQSITEIIAVKQKLPVVQSQQIFSSTTQRQILSHEVTDTIIEQESPLTPDDIEELLIPEDKTEIQSDSEIIPDVKIDEPPAEQPVPEAQKPLTADLKSIATLTHTREHIETEPRKIVTAVFKVKNPTQQKRLFISELLLPDKWQPITQEFEFTLEPDQSETKLVSFLVPQNCLADSYKVTYVIKDKQEPSVRDIQTLKVTVLPVSKIQAQLLEAPEFVIAGQPYKSKFVITNMGNSPYYIDLNVKSYKDLKYKIDTEEVALKPGESKIVYVTVQTDAKLDKKINHRVEIFARGLENNNLKTLAKTSSMVEVVPRVNTENDPYHRIPAKLTLTYVSEDNEQRNSGFQTEFRGDGTLDEEGNEHISFMFRGPDVQEKSIFGERDEYRFSYKNKKYELYFGDRNYSLSSLTENYLYGRGLEGKLNVSNDLSVGAYHMKTRWVEPESEQTAAYLDYQLDEDASFGLNYLRKDDDGHFKNITSFESTLKPFENTSVELEYAFGPGGSTDDNAYLTRIFGNEKLFSYYFKLTHAGTDYPGYYNNLDLVTGGIRVPISQKIRASASFRHDKRNLDLDGTLTSAPKEQYYQFGFDYKFSPETTFTLDWLNRERKDRLPTPSFDYGENTLRFGLNKTFEKFTFHTSAEFGETENKLTNETSTTDRYTASLYYKPNRKQSYSGYLYFDNDSDFTGESKRSTTVGFNARYNFSSRTSLQLNVQTNDYQNSLAGDRDNFELRFSHIFENENSISLSARQTIYRNSSYEDDTSLMVQYVIPVGLPVCQKKGVGIIKGYIYDQQTGLPIENVILRQNDYTAITDNGGYFTFPTVEPGNCYLNVDTASIGMNRVTSRTSPIQVNVIGGEKTKLSIPVTTAARLMGTVFIYKNPDNLTGVTSQDNSEDINYIADYGLANVIVELKDDSETKRTITNSKGRFTFEELRPGRWTCRIYSDNLPQYHFIEKDTLPVELDADKTGQLEFRILPQNRRIIMVGETKTIQQQTEKP